MKAIRINRFGPPDVMALEEIARPTPGEYEVLVRVKAAGVGPWDGWIRAGKSVLPQPLPLTLGSDLSGTIEAVGPLASGWKPGDEVFGVTNKQFTGAYAEHAVASASMIAKKPRALTDIEAAAVPVVAVTAFQMLFDFAHVTAGQRVLIHGAGGNVGAFAVQLARREGAHVIGTDVSEGDDYLRSLGANEIINIRSTRFEDAVDVVDVVIDTVGGDVQKRSLSVLKPGGILVSAVSQPDADETKRCGVRGTFMLVDVNSEVLARIAGMFDAGQLKTRVGTVLPLAEARAAHEMMDGLRPRQRGKIVLTIAS